MESRETLRSEFLLARRPHLELRGLTLSSLVSGRTHRVLSPREAALWTMMREPVPVGQVRNELGKGADMLIGDFLRSRLCEWLDPQFPAQRRRVLVLEPHADDASLSVGAIIWQRRFECEFIVATMASRSNHTVNFSRQEGHFDVDLVTSLRVRESELYVRTVGGRHVSVGLTDAALRYRDENWTVDFCQRHYGSICAYISRVANGELLQRWTEAMRGLLATTPSDEVWLPIGGPHADHMLTVDAFWQVARSAPAILADRTVRLYEDVPYAARQPRLLGAALAALEHAGGVFEREIVPIDGLLERKLRLASIYASQAVEEMQADVEASATRAGSGAPAEVLRTVLRFPRSTDGRGVVSSAMAPSVPPKNVSAWLARNRRARRVRLLLLTPTGRWAEDLKWLCEAFARAQFEIYASPAAHAEVSETCSERVELRRTAGGIAGLLRLSLSSAIRPLPTLFHVSERRVPQAYLLSSAWIGTDSLILTAMDGLVNALRQPGALALADVHG